jgi:hypothetical protein
MTIKYPPEADQLHSLKKEDTDISELTPKYIIPAPMLNYTTRLR